MKRNAEEYEYVRCFACFKVVSRPERHHAPTPQRHGGVETQTLCVDCHDWVDRVPLDSWPLELYVQALGSWEKMPLGARLMLLKLTSLSHDVISKLKEPR